MGVYYESGTVVDKDPVKAFALIKRAADSGITEAQFRLAGYYQNGTGVTQDLIAAAGWYDRAAQANYAPAHLALGNLTAFSRPCVHGMIHSIRYRTVFLIVG